MNIENDDRIDENVRKNTSVVVASYFTVTVTVLAGLFCIVLPALIGIYNVLVQCSTLYSTTTFRIVVDSLYLFFLVVSIIFEITYMAIFTEYATEINTAGQDTNYYSLGSFEFISGWISVGLWVVSLILGVTYLVLILTWN